MTASARRSRASTVLGAVACVALLAGGTGCGAMASDPVRKQWESRAPLTGCGSLHLQQGEELAADGKPEIACLQRGLDSGRGAELTVRHLTTEGDPVTSYYRVTGRGSTEVYVDSSHDAFSDRKWSFASCDHPVTVLDVDC